MTTYPLHYLYFYLTCGCNLRCRHCWMEPEFRGDGNAVPGLDYDLFTSIVEQAEPLGLAGVKLTGGEPLIHPSIREILGLVRDKELALTVETNGVLCSRDISRRVSECKDAFVSVSVDGASETTHEWMRGVKGSFRAALKGIGNLVAQGIAPQVIMSVMRRNVEEMEDLVGLAESLGAGSVKFNVVQPTARGEQMHRAGETLSVEELVELGRKVEADLVARARIPVYFDHPPAFLPLSRMFGPSQRGCDKCGILRILGVLSDGSYALCGIGETEPDLIFGHAERDRLRDVWEESPVLQEIRTGMPERLDGICSTCLMKALCLGSCVAQNYHRTKTLWGPYWFCEEARKKGLFPETRKSPDPAGDMDSG